MLAGQFTHNNRVWGGDYMVSTSTRFLPLQQTVHGTVRLFLIGMVVVGGASVTYAHTPEMQLQGKLSGSVQDSAQSGCAFKNVPCCCHLRVKTTALEALKMTLLPPHIHQHAVDRTSRGEVEHEGRRPKLATKTTAQHLSLEGLGPQPTGGSRHHVDQLFTLQPQISTLLFRYF